MKVFLAFFNLLVCCCAEISTAKLPVFTLKSKKEYASQGLMKQNLPLEMLPVEIILNLVVTKNENVMKELCFKFLC